ncbi:single-stranded DNA-binding protein [Staphylococcus nepalensis]|uniref:single-stranded DNA-binding protein n=1 Tax=Staphylococcus nepalensis TaxID=214473 RepID=UPI000BC337A3|nr:single-stranded DNA-binding protein [Staphylococcus nepalensis]ATH60408.1 single-stranded DNA-binding protein [Staphylococcus nepalensis]ATH61478.1 single-stranded DNA-binding protein [Staphylococcus nepalensis]ATH65457.1 single-stranded DNA-binding protein [Staphylococcus nepalensis]
MKITGQTQFTKETNQEKFYNGTTGFQAGEFTVKVKKIELNDRENRYFTIVFENDEGKQYKHNQFVPPYKYDFQEKQLIELLTRLGIKLNLPSLDFDTEELVNKFCHLVLKWKFNENEGKYFTDFSYIKPYKQGDEIVNKPIPKDEKMKSEENGTNNQKESLNSESNPFANANGPIDISDDDLPF